MESAKSSRHRVFTVQRVCERSRVQAELIVAAYELAAPRVRRRLSAPGAQSGPVNAHPRTSPSPVALGGIRA